MRPPRTLPVAAFAAGAGAAFTLLPVAGMPTILPSAEVLLVLLAVATRFFVTIVVPVLVAVALDSLLWRLPSFSSVVAGARVLVGAARLLLMEAVDAVLAATGLTAVRGAGFALLLMLVFAALEAVVAMAAVGTSFVGDGARVRPDLRGEPMALNGEAGSVRELCDFGDKMRASARRGATRAPSRRGRLVLL